MPSASEGPRPPTRWLALTLGAIALTILAAAPRGLRELQTQWQLAITRDLSVSGERRSAAWRWLADQAPEAAFRELTTAAPGLTENRTSSYHHSRSRTLPQFLYPSQRACPDEEAAERVAEALVRVAERDDDRAAALAAALVRNLTGALEPALCFAENLDEPERGTRRAAFVWLTRNTDFPKDYDWAAPMPPPRTMNPELMRTAEERAAFERRRTLSAWILRRSETQSSPGSSGRGS